MRALKHLALFSLCAGAALLMGYYGAVMSLATFAPGGDVQFSEEQKRRTAMGDAILAVYDWPSQRLLGVDHSWAFSSVAYGAVLYGAFIGSHKCFRKTAAR